MMYAIGLCPKCQRLRSGDEGNYCGDCGTKLIKECPECHTKLESASGTMASYNSFTHCKECSYQLTTPKR